MNCRKMMYLCVSSSIWNLNCIHVWCGTTDVTTLIITVIGFTFCICWSPFVVSYTNSLGSSYERLYWRSWVQFVYIYYELWGVDIPDSVLFYCQFPIHMLISQWSYEEIQLLTICKYTQGLSIYLYALKTILNSLIP